MREGSCKGVSGAARRPPDEVCRANRRFSPPVNEIVKGKRGVTEDTALRFAAALGTSPGFWPNLQQRWDLYHPVNSEEAIEIERVDPVGDLADARTLRCRMSSTANGRGGVDFTRAEGRAGQCLGACQTFRPNRSGRSRTENRSDGARCTHRRSPAIGRNPPAAHGDELTRRIYLDAP